MRKTQFFLFILFTAGFLLTAATISIPGLDNPTAVVIDQDQLYIVNGRASIHVFSLKNFEFKLRFGEVGEGAGQFTVRPGHHVDLQFTPSRILINSDQKVSFFSRDGRFIREVKLTGPPFTFGYRPCGKGYACISAYSENGTNYYGFNICDDNLRRVKEVTRVLNDYQPDSGITAFAMSWQFYVYRSKIFILEKKKGLTIDVYDLAGKPIYSIKHGYEPVKVLQSHVDGVHQSYKTNPYTRDEYPKWIKNALAFPEFFPAVRAWNVADDRLYIFTYREEGGKSELVIFDIRGNLIRKSLVPFFRDSPDIDRVNPYTIADDKLYQVVKDPKRGGWELSIIDLKDSDA